MVKQISFMLAFLAIALLAISLASATDNIILSSSSSVTLAQGESGVIEVSVNNSNDTFELTNIVLSSNAPGFESVTVNNVVNNSSGKVSFRISIPFSQIVGNYEYTLKLNGKINGTSITEESATFKVNVIKSVLYDICGVKFDKDGNNISFGEVEDNEDGNEDEWEWMPSNKISLTINNIENKVDDDEKFDISLLFYDGTTKVSGSKIASDDDDLKVNDLKIDGDDDEDLDIEFTIASDADSADYDMYVKVEGKYGCYVEKVTSVSIDTEEGDYSIISDVNGPSSSSCGENVDLTVTASNIGDDDADRVKVILYNKDLGINMYKEIDNLDQGDEAVVSFSFVAPQSAVERSYKFLLYTEFDYDEDDDSYGEESDSEYDYTYTLGLSGNCVDPTKPTLGAKINSSAIVGENLVVAVTFKNNGNASVSAILAPEDYESWAELVSIEPATITVGRAESKTVYMTFKPIKEGQQTFNLNAIYSGKSIDQPVTVKIESNASWISSLKDQFGKVGAYLIVGIVVLIALIILVLIIKLIVGLARKH